MKKIVDNIINNIEENQKYDEKEILKLLIQLSTDGLKEIKENFDNILNYKDLFHLFNNYSFDKNLYVEETLYYVKEKLNYKKNLEKKHLELLNKIKNDDLNNKDFRKLIAYLYLTDYKNIDSSFIDYIFKIKLLDESNSIPKSLIKHLVNAYTYNELKSLKIKNASSSFAKQNEMGLCTSNMLYIDNIEDLNIKITYSYETLSFQFPDLLETIHHELRHAEVIRNLKDSINYYSYDLVKSYCIYNLIEDNEENYQNDKTEIDATVFGAVNTYKYLKKLFPNIKKSFLDLYIPVFKIMNKRRNNNYCIVNNQKQEIDYIFSDYIKLTETFLKYSKKFPIINYEYRLDDKKVIRKSTKELLKEKQKVLNIFDYCFYETLIEKRNLNKNDFISDGFAMLECEDPNLFTEINNYLHGSYLEKLEKLNNDPNDFYFKTMYVKLKKEINNYSKKTPNNSIRVRCNDAKSGI